MGEGPKSQSVKNPNSPAEPQFFSGMVWPVPLAFSGAIAAMRFEQGDVLYRDRRAYEALETDLPEGLSAVQVILPKRSARVPSEIDGDRRTSNWRSEVTIELVDLVAGKTETRILTQGKLAMAIFRGDDTWLDPEREEPVMLRSARELQQRLEEMLPSFDARQRTRRGCRFLFVVDVASDASRSKAASVENALRSTGALERIELSAEQAGIGDAAAYHPSAVVRCLAMAKRTTEDVLPILRGCLYGGASDRSENSDVGDEEGKAAADRFSVGRHGILQAIPAEPAATRSR